MRRPASAQRITLFPFLAVLICTMGALLVLLVVISKRAQATAASQEAKDTQAELTSILRQQEELSKGTEELHRLRKEITSHIKQKRKVLAHIEDHMRRLGEQIRRLQASSLALDEEQSAEQLDPEKLKAELKQLKASRNELESLIGELQSRPKKKTTSYRIVPYNGTNGTNRRPIYLECKSDGVYFQPEGIHLDEKDFARPLGPENPLASGIRAQSGFLRQHRGTSGDSVDPYPLLIVRPSGIKAYYAARVAIRSWGSEFGYELVDEDTPLDFDPPDPTLARVTQEALNIARPRHQFMVARARELTFRSGQRTSETGGNGRGRMVGVGQGDDGNGMGGGVGHSGYGGPVLSGGEGRMHGTDSDRNRSALRRAEAARKVAAQSRQGDSTTSSSLSSKSANPDGTNALQGSATEGTPGNPSGQSDEKAGTSGVGGGSPPEAENGGLSLQFGSPSSQSHPSAESPISDVRGENWALPGISQGSFPFARPIRVEMTVSEIILVPTDTRQKMTRVPYQGDTRAAIEQFVAAIWQYMETWGTAGRGMYWKPVLNIYSEAEATDRATELEQLLRGSGLEVNRMPQSNQSGKLRGAAR